QAPTASGDRQTVAGVDGAGAGAGRAGGGRGGHGGVARRGDRAGGRAATGEAAADLPPQPRAGPELHGDRGGARDLGQDGGEPDGTGAQDAAGTATPLPGAGRGDAGGVGEGYDEWVGDVVKKPSSSVAALPPAFRPGTS